jgi:hypothetical protein
METQEKETKNKIINLSKWFLGVLGAYLVSAIIKSITSNLNLWESIKKIADFLFQVEIGLLALILILFILVYSLNEKNKKLADQLKNELSDKNIKEILADNKRFIKLLDELRDKTNRIIKINETLRSENEVLSHLKISLKNLEPKDEVLFILEILANIPNKTEKLGNLRVLYRQKFKKEMSDLQIILNELEHLGFIEETECGEFGEICYSILSKGLQFLKHNRKRD